MKSINIFRLIWLLQVLNEIQQCSCRAVFVMKYDWKNAVTKKDGWREWLDFQHYPRGKLLEL